MPAVWLAFCATGRVPVGRDWPWFSCLVGAFLVKEEGAFLVFSCTVWSAVASACH